jgi:hypothetical protein
MKTLRPTGLLATASLVGVIATLSVTGCGDTVTGSGEPPSTVSAALQPLADCGALEATIRAAAVDSARRRIDASLAAVMARGNPGECMMYASAAGAEDGASQGTPTASNGGGAAQASKTNNQIVGVDEADFVKNDNEYVYVVTGSTFRIVDAWPAEATHQVAAVTVPGKATKLFVDGDRAVVFSSVGGGSGQTCTYGYECIPSADGSQTVMSVFDVSDRSAPKLRRTVTHTGSLIAARRIGTMVHAVVATAPVPFSDGYLDTCGKSLDVIIREHQAAKIAVEKQIAAVDLAPFLPNLVDSASPGQGNALCQGLYASALADGQAFTSLVSFDSAETEVPEAATMTTVLSSPGVVMGAPDAMYLAVPHVRAAQSPYGWFEGMEGELDASDLHKFAVGKTPADTRYVASGVVKGRVLNQFSLDEHEGNLRVATTSSRAPSPDAHSTLTVLQTQGSTLARVGAVDHLAPSEDIRSVRFDGDRAFVVTFKKTDPLYAFDLSSPTAPRLTGELKIPGFSTYMHMMDATHLLTIGYDAVDHGDFAYFDGVLFQIFDVSSPASPVQTFTHKVGTRGSSSEALTNHLAFNYFAPKNLLAVPMTICEGGGDGQFGDQMTFSGLMVLDVTATSGFALHGEVSHPASSAASCNNWWTNASSEVRRSIVLDDYVLSLSDTRLKVNKLNDLGTDVAEISLTTSP